MKKKILALTLCLALLVCSVFSVSVFADTGAGYTYDEATDTYTVTTADGFVAVVTEMNAGNLDATILLAASVFHFHLIDIPELKEFMWKSGYQVKR